MQLIAEAGCAASAHLLGLFLAATAGTPPRVALDTIVAPYLDQSQGLSAPCSLAGPGSALRHSDRRVKDIAMDGHRRRVDFVNGHTGQLDIADAVVAAMAGAVTIARLAAGAATANTLLDKARAVLRGLPQAPARSSARRRGPPYFITVSFWRWPARKV